MKLNFLERLVYEAVLGMLTAWFTFPRPSEWLQIRTPIRVAVLISIA
jgi:hypothetical protein